MGQTEIKISYSSDNYDFVFQATGISYLFSDFYTRYYNEFNNVIFSSHDQYRNYILKHDVYVAKNSYQQFYFDEHTVQISCVNFANAYKALVQLRNKLCEVKGIHTTDFETFVSYAAIILREYSKFDPIYTAHFLTDTRESVKELMDVVFGLKNKLREQVNDIFFNDGSCLVILLDMISQKYGLSRRHLQYVSINEIRELLHDGVIPPLRLDNTDYVFVHDGDISVSLVGDEATVFISKFLLYSDIEGVDKINGISVSTKGLWQETVKIAKVDYVDLKNTLEVLEKETKGKILVTDSTIPEMFTAISNAIAVVTDMGGMLSHAAITCRELKKPCIIGTKIATQVLHDGDHVEVDAEKGIVTILERAK
jgi:phosphohistidine swiveling domain-containing protein